MKVNDFLKFVLVAGTVIYGAIIPFSLLLEIIITGDILTWADVGFLYLLITVIIAFAGLLAAVMIKILER